MVVHNVYIIDFTQINTHKHKVYDGIVSDVDTLGCTWVSNSTSHSIVTAVQYRVFNVQCVDTRTNDNTRCVNVIQSSLDTNFGILEMKLSGVDNRYNIGVVACTSAQECHPFKIDEFRTININYIVIGIRRSES